MEPGGLARFYFDSDDGDELAVSGYSGNVVVWDWRAGRVRHRFAPPGQRPGFNAELLHGEGWRVAVNYEGQYTEVWDVERGTRLVDRGGVMLDRGATVLLSLDPTKGHEQRGVRPAVVVSDPAVTASRRFPVLCVVPLTGTRGRGALYPPIRRGRSGLSKRSFALVDQIRSVDKRRVLRALGTITSSELAAIDEGLRLYLGLG